MTKLSNTRSISSWAKPPVVIVIVILVALIAWRCFSRNSDVADTSLRWFVCSETRNPFQAHLEFGMTVPIISPFTKKPTGYPAELCYWNKDGSIKTANPTPVLLNTYIGDPSPTFCPECGRLVVGHNPAPNPARPTITRQEWERRSLAQTAH